MGTILILNGKIINEGKVVEKDILIEKGKIKKIDTNLSHHRAEKIIDAKGLFILPGVIDDQVHFRQPGLTHKATIFTESRAAVRGGVTSFMDMPNTYPPTITEERLEEKYQIAKKNSIANYSFYMGVSNENAEEVLKTNPNKVCGLKAFLGSSTGNLLVDNEKTLQKICASSPMLLATHCEDEKIIKENTNIFLKKTGNHIDASYHEKIRSVEACIKSSSFIISLTKKYQNRIHILHISTEDEIGLIKKEKKNNPNLSAEVCVHHLWFDAQDYKIFGNKIKCNPSIKHEKNKKSLLKAVLNDTFDIIATDHAPHTEEEKQKIYWDSPAGIPLVQHGLLIMLEKYKKKEISLTKIVDKMCHSPANIFKIKERGFLREGYWGDITIIDTRKKPHTINNLYKCAWSPFDNYLFSSDIIYTIVSGNVAYEDGKFSTYLGKRLEFEPER